MWQTGQPGGRSSCQPAQAASGDRTHIPLGPLRSTDESVSYYDPSTQQWVSGTFHPCQHTGTAGCPVKTERPEPTVQCGACTPPCGACPPPNCSPHLGAMPVVAPPWVQPPVVQTFTPPRPPPQFTAPSPRVAALPHFAGPQPFVAASVPQVLPYPLPRPQHTAPQPPPSNPTPCFTAPSVVPSGGVHSSSTSSLGSMEQNLLRPQMLTPEAPGSYRRSGVENPPDNSNHQHSSHSVPTSHSGSYASHCTSIPSGVSSQGAAKQAETKRPAGNLTVLEDVCACHNEALSRGFPAGPIQGAYEHLEEEVRRWARDCKTGGGGHGIRKGGLGGPEAKRRGKRVRFQCAKDPQRSELCKWECTFEDTSDGWVLIRAEWTHNGHELLQTPAAVMAATGTAFVPQELLDIGIDAAHAGWGVKEIDELLRNSAAPERHRHKPKRHGDRLSPRLQIDSRSSVCGRLAVML